MTSARCVALCLMLAASPAIAEDRSWHLLTITEGGTVTLLRDLTKHECEFAMHRAMGQPATDEEIAAAARDAKLRSEQYEAADKACQGKPDGFLYPESVGGSPICWGGKASGWMSTMAGGHMISPGDIRSAECFQ